MIGPAVALPAAVLLAGGRGSRMGGAIPKPLIDLAGRTLAERTLDAVRAHCAPILVSAADTVAFASLSLPLVDDLREGRLGPLAGLEAAARWLAVNAPDTAYLVSIPGDTPFLPADLVPRLAADAGETVRVARSATGTHPTVALWPVCQLGRLGPYLDRPGVSLSVRAFLEDCGWEAISFEPDPRAPGGDPFFNVNTPGDLAAARSMLVNRAL
ncbi:molybdenum cofactor guanylyltransferase [Aureimonas mangrovi]|uniref:molybdenum cofactor guanylyltransferase n=1 Tax=Aureimonas mangrovi TaxID=2758041 RepID=UPI00163DB835|nr:NTP transferase domain-containing protein [Aureimonas mangrovi]